MVKPLMTWANGRWVKAVKGRDGKWTTLAVSPRQLKCPATKEGSVKAANAWWEQQKEKLAAAKDESDITLELLERVVASGLCDRTGWGIDADQRFALRVRVVEAINHILTTGTPPTYDPLGEHRDEVLRELQELEATPAKSEPKATEPPDHIRAYIESKRLEAAAEKISLHRVGMIAHHLRHFEEFRQGQPITSLLLHNYYNLLLGLTAKSKLSASTAKQRLSVVKSFASWASDLDLIPTPKGLRRLKIESKPPNPEVFTVEEVKTILEGSNEREKLLWLLMLNCGFRQLDIATLKPTEVDWKEGRIRRKRKKTEKFANVPVVEWLLWRETFRLLKEQGNTKGDRVLLNRNGKPLKVYIPGPDDKTQVVDDIKLAWRRLKTRLGDKAPTKPLRAFRSTSSSLLYEKPEYTIYASHFCGHSPKGITNRHYNVISQAQFDNAVRSLGLQYGIG
jgi:integrase